MKEEATALKNLLSLTDRWKETGIKGTATVVKRIWLTLTLWKDRKQPRRGKTTSFYRSWMDCFRCTDSLMGFTWTQKCIFSIRTYSLLKLFHSWKVVVGKWPHLKVCELFYTHRFHKINKSDYNAVAFNLLEFIMNPSQNLFSIVNQKI